MSLDIETMDLRFYLRSTQVRNLNKLGLYGMKISAECDWEAGVHRCRCEQFRSHPEHTLRCDNCRHTIEFHKIKHDRRR